MSNDYNDKLIVTGRQVTFIVASVLAICFFCFVIGYFLGQQKAIRAFTQSASKATLEDEIYATAMAHTYDTEIPENSEKKYTPILPKQDVSILSEASQENKCMIDSTNTVAKKWYAQLIGYGSKKNAEKFVSRLQQQGTQLKINEHTSYTSKGKPVKWYQVVTGEFADEEILNQLVDIIKKKEKLNGVRIIAC
jgi:cell division septation protein DedD